jgi:hypothetical protein
MMDDGSQPMQSPAYQNRNQSFGTGMNGDQGETPAPVGSPGLAEDQQSMAAQQPRGIRPTATMNGMASGQFQATMGGMFRTQNGSASSTYDTGKYFEPRQS